MSRCCKNTCNNQLLNFKLFCVFFELFVFRFEWWSDLSDGLFAGLLQTEQKQQLNWLFLLQTFLLTWEQTVKMSFSCLWKGNISLHVSFGQSYNDPHVAAAWAGTNQTFSCSFWRSSRRCRSPVLSLWLRTSWFSELTTTCLFPTANSAPAGWGPSHAGNTTGPEEAAAGRSVVLCLGDSGRGRSGAAMETCLQADGVGDPPAERDPGPRSQVGLTQ